MGDDEIRRFLAEVRRTPAYNCSGCGVPCAEADPYCMKCGAQNKHFKFESFMEEHKCTSIELARQNDCSWWHSVYKALPDTETSVGESILGSQRFCPLCGVDILRRGIN